MLTYFYCAAGFGIIFYFLFRYYLKTDSGKETFKDALSEYNFHFFLNFMTIVSSIFFPILIFIIITGIGLGKDENP